LLASITTVRITSTVVAVKEMGDLRKLEPSRHFGIKKRRMMKRRDIGRDQAMLVL
jgi:hypothetical protein